MIFFFADNHYGVHPGRVLYEHLPSLLPSEPVRFFEDDPDAVGRVPWVEECSLLILHMIGESCSLPHPGPDAEKAVRKYLERGGNILLLHGSSAAFWKWDFWRALTGLRWVRENDPDHFEPSTHPHEPYEVRTVKTRHPLVKQLKNLRLPKDEIYTELEQTRPVSILMESSVGTRSYPQCFETVTDHGSRILSFLPGHGPSVTAYPPLLENEAVLIRDLLHKQEF